MVKALVMKTRIRFWISRTHVNHAGWVEQPACNTSTWKAETRDSWSKPDNQISEIGELQVQLRNPVSVKTEATDGGACWTLCCPLVLLVLLF